MSGESATRITPGNAFRPEDVAAQVAQGLQVGEDVAEYALRLGDDALILAQRLGWWISRAPELEEDIALGNIALDQIGHARSFLTYAGAAWGKSEDDLAYFRGEDGFRSSYLVEQPNGDFGKTIARQLVISVYQHELYSRLVASTDATLAAVAAKALKEVDYHRDHAKQWTLRLGDGTEESNRRITAGLVSVWPYVDQLFQDDELIERLDGVAVRPSELREPFDAYIAAVLAEAGLEVPQVPNAMTDKSRRRHSEHLGYLLAEMQVLAREHPGATW
ncbi:1,2-phenylacetyl-CoA epoxidase subunit PaaC [Arthrobacter mangrovi]|uniref:Phenylacetate-CoA oxygenase subunit PaaI n=1 Tax=Arthrobacter mangrovi TaxID=2966350 RepID=A0ABQ5MUK3_9MICC|nr:1,2-phenylacetyl-CoA epoxidase subunit PaaC [Arthrobacter mangrovi]GLB67618.1 phenylacetate-CoA oxygenase subunit PaaI [Arthrobacter mangrovi]